MRSLLDAHVVLPCFDFGLIGALMALDNFGHQDKKVAWCYVDATTTRRLMGAKEASKGQMFIRYQPFCAYTIGRFSSV